MSALPIAANLSSTLYAPLVLLLVGCVVASILATRARAADDRAGAEHLAGIGFGLVLASAVYVVVLLLSAVIQYWARVYDMLIIVFVILVFFALLLLIFFLLAEFDPARPQARRRPLASGACLSRTTATTLSRESCRCRGSCTASSARAGESPPRPGVRCSWWR